MPVVILDEATHHAQCTNSTATQTIADLIWIGFFWLLWSGEYLLTATGQAPFLLQDVYLKATGKVYQADTIPLRLLTHITDVSLKFNEQKNQIKGEIIWLLRSRHPLRCPVQSVTRWVKHLRWHSAPPPTPLYSYYKGNTIH